MKIDQRFTTISSLSTEGISLHRPSLYSITTHFFPNLFNPFKPFLLLAHNMRNQQGFAKIPKHPLEDEFRVEYACSISTVLAVRFGTKLGPFNPIFQVMSLSMNPNHYNNQVNLATTFVETNSIETKSRDQPFAKATMEWLQTGFQSIPEGQIVGYGEPKTPMESRSIPDIQNVGYESSRIQNLGTSNKTQAITEVQMRGDGKSGENVSRKKGSFVLHNCESTRSTARLLVPIQPGSELTRVLTQAWKKVNKWGHLWYYCLKLVDKIYGACKKEKNLGMVHAQWNDYIKDKIYGACKREKNLECFHSQRNDYIKDKILLIFFCMIRQNYVKILSHVLDHHYKNNINAGDYRFMRWRILDDQLRNFCCLYFFSCGGQKGETYHAWDKKRNEIDKYIRGSSYGRISSVVLCVGSGVQHGLKLGSDPVSFAVVSVCFVCSVYFGVQHGLKLYLILSAFGYYITSSEMSLHQSYFFDYLRLIILYLQHLNIYITISFSLFLIEKTGPLLWEVSFEIWDVKLPALSNWFIRKVQPLFPPSGELFQHGGFLRRVLCLPTRDYAVLNLVGLISGGYLVYQLEREFVISSGLFIYKLGITNT